MHEYIENVMFVEPCSEVYWCEVCSSTRQFYILCSFFHTSQTGFVKSDYLSNPSSHCKV